MDGYHVKAGVDFTHANLKDDVGADPPMDEVPSLDVPVYFFEGRRDFTVPSACAQRYFEQLKAPRKSLVWFEHSAHFPFLEESSRFAAELQRVAAETSGSR
jgi:pimeloyl-ACP methyl ester carboxylesterase